MRQALAPLLFDDEELDPERWQRDLIAPAKPSKSARREKSRKETEDGFPMHSFDTLMEDLATRVRNECCFGADPDTSLIEQVTEPTELQQCAFELLGLFPGTDTPKI
jgi:hypothetical protein